MKVNRRRWDEFPPDMSTGKLPEPQKRGVARRQGILQKGGERVREEEDISCVDSILQRGGASHL